ncbi:hypothetical protein ACGFJT_37320 [Actinomadura geliboluensis]
MAELGGLGYGEAPWACASFMVPPARSSRGAAQLSAPGGKKITAARC